MARWKIQWLVLVAGMVCAVLLFAQRDGRAGQGRLAEEIEKLKIPPAWFDGVTVHYDMTKPWKDARIHVRKLLGEGKNPEAVKISYIYHAENRGSKDRHEYPMYLFLGGEYAWAAKAYMENIARRTKGYTWENQSLASIYMRFGEPRKAVEALQASLLRLPDPPQRLMCMAGVHDSLGDVYAQTGDAAKARQRYNKAMEFFRRARPRFGRHLLPRRVAKLQTKLDLMARKTFDLSKVRDGRYRGRSLGYAKDIMATVTVKGGRITDIRLSHQEKIDQGATKIVPRQIIERQSLEVDAITGATVTVQAIVEATYRALSHAGAK